MNKKQRKIVLSALLLVLALGTIKAQEAIPSAGGESTGVGGTVSFTVGQTFSSTHDGITGSVAEGVQQPIEISVVSGIIETGIDLNISAYPNPTMDFLHLKVDASVSQNIQAMRYQIFDMNGRMIAAEEIVSDVTTIETAQLSPATYFVKVLGDDQELKTFKVIKY